MAAVSGFYVRMDMISNVPLPYRYHATSCLVMAGYRRYCLWYLITFHFREQCKAAESLKQNLKTTMLEDGKKRELISAIHGHFRDWLFGIAPQPIDFSFMFLPLFSTLYN
jgi:hypothetical protein